MRSFSIVGRWFQIPYLLGDVEMRMRLLEREYPECKTIKEMDEKIHQEYVEKRGDLEDAASNNFNEK